MDSCSRCDYIDFAKGLVMTSVIWGHILTAGWSFALIYSFHMPFFFFVSGMLFKKNKYPTFVSFIKSRWNTLLKPYLIYSVVFWCLWASFQYYSAGTLEHCWKPLLETLFARGGGGFLTHNSVLWFIPCLFVTEIIYYLLRNVKGWVLWATIFAMVIVNSMLTHNFGDKYILAMPWNIDTAIIALPFYAVGHFVTKHYTLSGIQEKIMVHKKIAIVYVCILTLFLIWAGTAWGESSIAFSRLGKNELTFYLRAFVGCSTSIVCSVLMVKTMIKWSFFQKSINFIKWIGQSSLDFMCTHISIKGVLITVMAKLLCITTLGDASWNDNSMFGLAFITFTITLILDSILVYFIRRYIRKIKTV